MATPQAISIDEWYFRILGEEFGPVSRDVLDGLIAEGQIGSDDEIRPGASGVWMPLASLGNRNGGRNDRHAADTVLSLDSLDSLDDADTAISGSSASGMAPQEWFYQRLGQDWGPVSFNELLDLARAGDLSPDDPIRLGRTGKWRRPGSMGRLMAVMPFSVREAKTIPTGKKTDFEFDTSVTLKTIPDNPVVPPPPVPPAPLPPPPLPPGPIPQMIVPQMVAPGYAQPVAPGWGYGQQPMTAPAVDTGWYAWLDGVECGPMEFTQIANWAKSGRVSQNDYIKQGKYSQWSLAKTVTGLTFPAATPPTPEPVPQAVASAVEPPKPARMPALNLPPPPVRKTFPGSAAARPAPTVETDEKKPDFPNPPSAQEASPARPPATDWNSSAVKSTHRPGASAAPPAAAKKPQAAKPKKQSGGGFDVNELAKDKRVLAGVGVVLLLVAGWFGKDYLPEGTGKLKSAHEELTKLHQEIEGKKADSADAEKWKSFNDSIGQKVKDATKGFGSSTHAARTPLTQAKTHLSTALKQKTPDDVGKKLGEAKKKLDDAAKKLGL